MILINACLINRLCFHCASQRLFVINDSFIIQPHTSSKFYLLLNRRMIVIIYPRAINVKGNAFVRRGSCKCYVDRILRDPVPLHPVFIPVTEITRLLTDEHSEISRPNLSPRRF